MALSGSTIANDVSGLLSGIAGGIQTANTLNGHPPASATTTTTPAASTDTSTLILGGVALLAVGYFAFGRK